MTARRPWAWPLVPVYRGALAAKEALRRAGMLRERRLAWPVVSVGSLSAGGAGKTPVVIALVRLLAEHGCVVDVLSRGYGREGKDVELVLPEGEGAARHFGDEPVLIVERTAAPVWVGKDRFAAGQAAEAFRDGNQHGVHVLDDGFQHRKLARDFDVVVVTAEDLQDALLPAGNLREPLAALRRADAVVVREKEAEKLAPRAAGACAGGDAAVDGAADVALPCPARGVWSGAAAVGFLRDRAAGGLCRDAESRGLRRCGCRGVSRSRHLRRARGGAGGSICAQAECDGAGYDGEGCGEASARVARADGARGGAADGGRTGCGFCVPLAGVAGAGAAAGGCVAERTGGAGSVKALRVLIVRVGAMGDVLHALPGVAALRAARPEWTIDWVVDPRWAALLVDGEGRGPVVNQVHLAETKLWSRAPVSWVTARLVLALRAALRERRYDLAVDMQGTLRSGVIAWMSGASRVVGYSDPRESIAAGFYSTKVARRGKHVVEQGAALLGEACGVELSPGQIELPREGWAEAWAEDLVGSRKLCVLAAGGGWGAKHWPVEKYGQLARELRDMGYAVVVNAPRKDDAVAHAAVAASEGAAELVVCNVAGLVALLRRTALLVGGDSGPTHLAAALRVPLVALFGPTDPERNGPWGPGPKRVLRDVASVTSYRHVDGGGPGAGADFGGAGGRGCAGGGR